MKSELVTKTILSPNYNIRKDTRWNPSGVIRGITIHHTGCVASAVQVANGFTRTNRQASANYIIDDNDIILCVPEECRAWTSGGKKSSLGVTGKMNDYTHITFEVCNNTGAPKWTIGSSSYKKMIALCADICSRYNIRPTFTNDSNGTFTYHDMFDYTLCPGPYIRGMTDQIINDVLREMNLPVPEKPAEKSSSSDGSFLVKVTASVLNVRKGPGTGYEIRQTVKRGEVFTIVKINGKWGKLKSGAGWIHLSYTERM